MSAQVDSEFRYSGAQSIELLRSDCSDSDAGTEKKNKTMKIIAFLIDRKTKDDGTKHSPIVFPIMGVAKCRP